MGISVATPRCRRIRPITAASSMSAIRRRWPPHRGHASTSNPKARAINDAQHWPRAWRRAVSAGSGSPACSVADSFNSASRPSCDVWCRTRSARQATRGPSTPWYSIRLMRVRGTSTASRPRNSTGWNTTSVVPSHHGCRSCRCTRPRGSSGAAPASPAEAARSDTRARADHVARPARRDPHGGQTRWPARDIRLAPVPRPPRTGRQAPKASAAMRPERYGHRHGGRRQPSQHRRFIRTLTGRTRCHSRRPPRVPGDRAGA